MTSDADKTREQLLTELEELRQRLVEAREETGGERKSRSREARLLRQSRALVELARRRTAPGEDVDTALREITRKAARTLGCERASVWLYNEDRSAIRCADLYERSTGSHSQGQELAAAGHPSYFRALERERTIAAHDARTDPRTRDFLTGYLVPLNITSMLDAPIHGGGRMIGVVCHEHVGSPRRWTQDEQSFAGSIADAVSLALEESETRKAEAERSAMLARERAARAEAEAANRTKDEFLATVSHELRTPLNAIVGWLHLLRTGGLDAATTDRALATIERNVWAQAQIVDDILDVSRIIRGSLALHVGPVDLAGLLERAVESLRPAIQAKGLDVQSAVEPEACYVHGDPDRLQQVAWNLLSNAIKFTPPAGKVEVRLERLDDTVRLTITDTGQGITPEFLPHVFERFRQADSSKARLHGGLGLGLAIVRHLVELHGGTVTAESAGHGQGARFTVTLPAVPAGLVDSGPAFEMRTPREDI
jgi:signal transduction histidine kinase